jgi:hypothetical protein
MARPGSICLGVKPMSFAIGGGGCSPRRTWCAVSKIDGIAYVSGDRGWLHMFYTAMPNAIAFGLSQIGRERAAAKASFTKFFAIRDAAW